ncbi:MAG: DUF4886 domain-containing protein [Clostridia bacterium]|nr:DUF4886 domain-containing protein [Clostridia bacterium]
MRILSIGNSFSMDAQTWARDIALAGNVDIKLGNLYIGGCSLERHWSNAQSGEAAYEYFENNKPVGYAAMETVLADGKWDYVTLQQASHFSGMPETYDPYIEKLADFVREKAKDAKIAIHQTWAYESNSTHQGFPEYGCDRFQMHDRIRNAYAIAQNKIGAELIPVGEAVSRIRECDLFNIEKGGKQITRDGFHLSFIEGRYLAGAVWYEFFTGKDIRENGFVPQRMEYLGRDKETGEKILRPIKALIPSAEEMQALKEAAHEAAIR